MAMHHCLIVLDLDAELLKNSCHNTNGLADIRRVLNRHRFNNIQGTVYLSELGVRQAHGTLALQELAIGFQWFGKCVSNVQFYDLANDFNAQIIIDGITQARLAFERRIAELRQQLVGAGLALDKVKEIVGEQTLLDEQLRP